MIKKRATTTIEETADLLAELPSTTRLYHRDYLEVRSRCVGRKKESAVIRELVKKGLAADRLARAGGDPAVHQLLQTFDEIVAGRTTEVTAELAVESYTLRRLMASVLATSHATLKFLELYFGVEPPPPSRDLGEDGGFFDRLYDSWMGEADQVIQSLHEERERLLAERTPRALPCDETADGE